MVGILVSFRDGGWPIFRGKLLVSGNVNIYIYLYTVDIHKHSEKLTSQWKSFILCREIHLHSWSIFKAAAHLLRLRVPHFAHTFMVDEDASLKSYIVMICLVIIPVVPHKAVAEVSKNRKL